MSRFCLLQKGSVITKMLKNVRKVNEIIQIRLTDKTKNRNEANT